jgi:hypothetical protein
VRGTDHLNQKKGTRDMHQSISARQALILILAAKLAWTVVSTSAAGTSACAEGMAGSGTAEDPCQIETAAHLSDIISQIAVHYVLVDDIDLDGFANDPEPENFGWMPIDGFAGVLDGNDHVISNLYASSSQLRDRVGLFGTSDYPFVIRNLHLENASVSGLSRIGALIGEMEHEDALIENVTVSGQVTGSSYDIGGLVGYSAGQIVNAEAHVSVLVEEGTADGVGGLVGGNEQGTIRDSLATGDVTSHARSAVGGLVGYNDWFARIENSRATGNVTHIDGNRGAGGLAGWNHESTIINSHATGHVTAENTRDVGGLIGEMGYGATLEGGSASGTVIGDQRTGGLIGRVQQEGNWISNVQAHGDVTGKDYVGGLIGTIGKAELKGRVLATGNVQGADYVGGLIGELHDFLEILDNDIDQAYATGNVAGDNYVGGLIGSLEQFSGINTVHVTLSNVYATGDINASGDMIGGLIGTIWPTGDSMLYLNNAYSAGHVSGGTNVGGLVGYNLGEVTNSYWDVETSEQPSGVGTNENLFEAEGKDTASMQQQATFEGWNFSSIWSIRENADYPRLFDVIFKSNFEDEDG